MIEIQTSLEEVWRWSMGPWKNLLRSCRLRLAKRKLPAGVGRELTEKLATETLLRLLESYHRGSAKTHRNLSHYHACKTQWEAIKSTSRTH